MSNCFMVSRPSGGGGNRYSSNGIAPIIVRRTAAIGDSLSATVVADRLMDLGFEVEFQSHPACHCILKLHPRLHSVVPPNGHCHVDLDNAYENHPERRRRHYHSMFFERASAQLKPKGIDIGSPTNCRPRLAMPQNVKEAVQAKLSKYPKPWVMVCPRSDSFNVRQVPDGVWQDACKSIQGTCFWIGRHPGPPATVDLNCRHFDNVLQYLSVADIYLGAETGPMHVAAAFGVPCVVVTQATDAAFTLNDQNDFVTVSADLDCLHCQKTLCPKNAHIPPCQNVDPARIAAAVNSKLRQYTTEDVSAVIAIYQPEVQTLNRCIETMLPQVQEIIVTAEGNSIIPANAIKNGNVCYFQKSARKIGVGRNFNHGARYSGGKYLLISNDDIFLDPGAVEIMKSEMTDGVGAVSCFLRYPSGRVYHAGKVRHPGMRGWGHLDHQQFTTTWKDARDVENMCGACFLVRREAWFQIGGFDEDYFCYAEDDDLMLRIRKAGWRLRYTPFATGIHMEGQSTQKIGQPNEHIQQANTIFNAKFGAYLDWNINRCPMGDFGYLKA